MQYITRLEEIYLLAIWRLQDDAYGVQIKKKITEMTGKKISYGALYFTLEQLFKKGYVSRVLGEPTPVRGGCRKIFYTITPAAKNALKATFKLQKFLWDGISVLSF